MTTYAVGERGGSDTNQKMTTYALGEEGGDNGGSPTPTLY